MKFGPSHAREARIRRAGGFTPPGSLRGRKAPGSPSPRERPMPRSRPEPPACDAIVHPRLEAVAADEIERDLGGAVKRSGPGLVVFRVPEIDGRLLQLRTTEDVFLLAWGTDQLTHRAEDLERIRRWTAREPDWPQLLRLHHAV